MPRARCLGESVGRRSFVQATVQRLLQLFVEICTRVSRNCHKTIRNTRVRMRGGGGGGGTRTHVNVRVWARNASVYARPTALLKKRRRTLLRLEVRLELA